MIRQSPRRALGVGRRSSDDGRIYKARALRQVYPVSQSIANALCAVPQLSYIKLFPGRLAASSALSTDGRKNPVVTVGAADIVGVELLIDADAKVLQVFALTSAVKGCGRKMVAAVVAATPADWQVVMPMDWSAGFWQRMAEAYPRLVIF